MNSAAQFRGGSRACGDKDNTPGGGVLGGGGLGLLLPKETRQHAASSCQCEDYKPGGGKLGGGGGALFLLPPEKPNEERESITMLTT